MNLDVFMFFHKHMIKQLYSDIHRFFWNVPLEPHTLRESVVYTDLYMYGLITKSVRQARHGYSVQICIILRFFLA